ncbi:MAG: polysaccharide deacetylase family protein [Bacteroidia bacterium]|nr:polysaccharide deacetylase family protein [Bacteroidia bacterium]
MYHYVRDLKSSRFPEIKGLDIEFFKEQLEYLHKHYCIVTMEQLIKAVQGIEPLPQKAVLLTFDDAYIDHFINIFPILNEKGLQGSFYPPIKAITKHEVLDVNKIHFILASTPDKKCIIESIFDLLNQYRDEYKLKSNEHYWETIDKKDRHDTEEVIFIKRILQKGLEEEVRKKIVNHLFEKYVGLKEEMFSRELYMNIDQIKCLKRNGMHIGSHGYDHYWLSTLDKKRQENEIDLSLAFLESVGVDISSWTMCYPYGNYNENTIDILKDKGCKLALTTVVDIANISQNNIYELPRLDTNDIPKQRNAATNEWYEKG